MLKSHYDLGSRQCKDCGCVVAPDDASLKAHSCNDFRKPLDDIHKKYQVFPKTNPIFKMGETIEATMIGKVIGITVTEDGSIVYRLSDDDNNTHGYFKESQVRKLLEPEDLDDGGIGDLEYERQREEGTKEEEE